uniref:RBR-type E3 ubiquitin transferase n=1 Tax=Caenorhabditis tropicalis TaxID=1561998 RepID=A0A1I7TIU5_9PELO
MSDENRETQLYELEALESVLRENKLTKTNDWSDENVEIEGIIEVGFDSISDPKVTLEGTSKSGEPFSVPLDILPPIRLKFHLPKDYPSSSSPRLELQSYWMNEKQMLMCQDELKKICEENMMMGVLFLCYQGIIDLIDQMPTRIIKLNEAHILAKNEESIESLKKKILGKGEEAAEEHFANTLFDCEVCYDSLMGSKCIKFQPCAHVFCKSCTFDYYRSVAKGVVSKAMQCLAEGCKSEAPQNIVKEALGDELYSKYEGIMLEKAIREMDDTVECPRENCQKVAYVTDRERHLAECSYCQFSFCNLCKQTFHGVSSCKWKKGDKERLVKDWQEGDENTKAEMCRQFGGAKNVEVLVERFLNEEWLDSNSKPCPKCSVSIEKNEGCHKMHCTKCDTYFCWLCNAALDKEDPYKHFQGDGTCSGRLFEGVHHFMEDDEEEVFEMAFDDGSDYESDDSADFDIEAQLEDWLEEEGHFDDGPDGLRGFDAGD